MNERVNIDSIIDRYYLRLRGSTEPYELISKIHMNVKTIFTSQNIPRGYIKDRIFKLLKYQEQLQHLMTLPKLEQRSTEWYEVRQNLITASDFAQALGRGKFGTQKQFYQKKCGYEKDTFDASSPALKWGVMYEPVAVDAYASKNNMVMNEFGLLIHPEHKWFGASPDSITDLGIMVEIKCPWKRKITGEVPEQYMYQMQGQLDVCKLDECDFLECEFIQYSHHDEFCRHFHDNENEKGIIIEYKNVNDTTVQYDYSPFTLCQDMKKLVEWCTTRTEHHATVNTIIKIHFWQLHTYSVVRVYKDEAFLRENLEKLRAVWQQIGLYKKDKDVYDKDINAVTAPKTQKGPTYMINIDDDELPIIPKTNMPKTTVSRTTRDVQLSGYAFLSDAED